MWAGCDDTASDDDDHNTSNAFFFLCADALITPVLLTGLKVAFRCRFALDMFTVIQHECPIADQEPAFDDPGLAAWGSLLQA